MAPVRAGPRARLRAGRRVKLAPVLHARRAIRLRAVAGAADLAPCRDKRAGCGGLPQARPQVAEAQSHQKCDQTCGRAANPKTQQARDPSHPHVPNFTCACCLTRRVRSARAGGQAAAAKKRAKAVSGEAAKGKAPANGKAPAGAAERAPSESESESDSESSARIVGNPNVRVGAGKQQQKRRKGAHEKP